MINYGKLLEAVKNCDANLFSAALDDMSDDMRLKVLTDNNYEVFIWAANNGCVDILKKYLSSMPTNKWGDAIQANNFEAFSCAVANHHVKVVETLLDIPSSDQKINMIVVGADMALLYRHMDIIELILSHTDNDDEKSRILGEAAALGIIEGGHSFGMV